MQGTPSIRTDRRHGGCRGRDSAGPRAAAVTWHPSIAEADYITVVTVGTDPGVFGPYLRIGKANEVNRPVPGDEGPYEMLSSTYRDCT